MTRRSSLLLLAVAGFNLVYDAFLPLHPDEAYYWTWSRHLQLSYFDHPPMVAWLIRLTTLWSQSELAVRLVAVGCMTGAAWVLYRLARSLFNERVADVALLIMLFMPVTQVGYLVVTPDAPLVLFWTLALYCSYHALWEKRHGYLLLAGVCAGCLMLSKYTGALLLPALLVFTLSSRFRGILLRRDAYVTALLAFVIFSPVIIWNVQHDWLSLRFQFTHGVAGGKTFSFANLGDFLAGQALVTGPSFPVAFLYYAVRYIRTNLHDERLAFVFWPFGLTFAFFMYGGLFKRMEANWATPAYLSGSILLAYWIDRLGRRWIYYTGIALTVALVGLAKFPEILPNVPDQLVLKRQFLGYRETFLAGRKYVPHPGCVVLSDSYQHASEAWYYLGRRTEVYILTPVRPTEYDLRAGDLRRNPPREAVYFGDPDRAAGLRTYFADVRYVDVLRYRGRYVTRQIAVYRCSNPGPSDGATAKRRSH